MKKGNTSPSTHLTQGYYLSLDPVLLPGTAEPVIDQLTLSLRNQTSSTIRLQYRCEAKGEMVFSEEATLSAYDCLPLHTIALDLFNDHPKFTAIIRPPEMKKGESPAVYQVRIKIQKLFRYFSQVQTTPDSAPLNLKMQPSILRAEGTHKEKAPDRIDWETQPTRPRRARRIAAVDLHFEALAPNRKGLSNFEILSLQLQTLEDALDQAIRAQQQSLTIIHGVGTGKLKEEVHALLRTYREINFFQQEWSPRYGHGATIVFFNQ